MYKKYFKRPLDIILSTIALIVLSPVFLVVAILVRVKLGSPVIFKQKRPGLNEKIFTMYKFRSMTDQRDSEGNLLPDSQRLTKFGKWLRSTSLDELPELYNILIGEMSIVGPRPQLVKDLVFMTDEQRKRQTVLPGLTGLAQVSGRNDLDWEKKIKCDLSYIKVITLRMDIKIIQKTIHCVIRKEGSEINEENSSCDFGEYLLKTGRLTIQEYRSKLINIDFR